MASLAAFHAGTLSALCVVDLFNEGVDIPLVREPALPEGCVLDVELEAKGLLKLVLPAGRASHGSEARQKCLEFRPKPCFSLVNDKRSCFSLLS